MFNTRLLLCAIVAAGLSNVALADQFSIAANGTYLKASDTVVNPAIIQLSALTTPVHAGDTIVIQRLGAVKFNASDTLETGTEMSGVFSATNTLLSSGNLLRVPDAIDAGVDFTSPTLAGGVSTDITQDFHIDDAQAGLNRHFSSVTIQVPQGANYLFVGIVDNVYSDNVDTNGDFGVSVTLVPEPASLAILGLGVLPLLRSRCRA